MISRNEEITEIYNGVKKIRQQQFESSYSKAPYKFNFDVFKLPIFKPPITFEEYKRLKMIKG